MGSVTPYSTSDGRRYRVRYRTPDRRQTDKRGFRTKRDAELFLAKVEVAKHRGEYVAPADSRATIGELSEAWLASKEKNLKPSSYAPLKASWTNYVKPRWGDTPVSAVRHSDVQAWVDSIDMSASVVHRAYGILAGILDVALRDRRITVNHARGVALPDRKPARAHRYLTHQQLLALADASGPHGALVLTLGWCGLRWGEAIELRVSDLNLLRRRIRVARAGIEVAGTIHVGTPKNGEARDVPIPKRLVKMLEARCSERGPNDLVFDDGHGNHMRRTRASAKSKSWFKTALAKSGIPAMTLHELRHTAASLAVSSGANVKAVQRMLGHASATMTLDTYADLFDDDLDALSKRLDQAIASASVGKVWARA